MTIILNGGIICHQTPGMMYITAIDVSKYPMSGLNIKYLCKLHYFVGEKISLSANMSAKYMNFTG